LVKPIQVLLEYISQNLRFVTDPTDGCIRLGGSALPEISLSAYRSRLALVSQQPTLFQGSIQENIALGGVGGKASMEQIEQAARDGNI
jgi:ATP-binding cassette, subfamily B (MDR/TAP), member 1